MTTLRKEAELIIRDLSGGPIPSDSPYDQDYVIQAYRDAMNEDLKMETLTRRHGPSDDKSPVAQFIATYEVDVKKDKLTSQGRVYASLPENFLSLKYNGGIHSVSEPKKSLKTMVRANFPHVSSHLPHLTSELIIPYYIEGMAVCFTRNILQEDITKVLIKLITAAPAMFGPDDELPILPESSAKIRRIVKQDIMNRFPNDRIADNNPNIRATNEQSK